MTDNRSIWKPGVSTIVPKADISEADEMPISATAYRLWASFSRQNRDGLVPASAKELAEKYPIGIAMIRLAIPELLDLGLIRRFYAQDQDIVSILSGKTPSYFATPTGKTCDWCQSEALTLEKHHYPVRKKDGGTKTCSICPSCHSEFHSLADVPRWEIAVDFPWEAFAVSAGGQS
jgi:hypothetical protein